MLRFWLRRNIRSLTYIKWLATPPAKLPTIFSWHYNSLFYQTCHAFHAFFFKCTNLLIIWYVDKLWNFRSYELWNMEPCSTLNFWSFEVEEQYHNKVVYHIKTAGFEVTTKDCLDPIISLPTYSLSSYLSISHLKKLRLCDGELRQQGRLRGNE